VPRADVAVVGVGLAGLTSAIALAEGGARVHVVATGFATTHWAAGGFDAGVVRGAATPQAAVDRLARKIGHPYRLVAAALPAALEWVRGILAEEGLTIVGGLSDPLRAIPTALGSTRIAAVLPDGMAAALAPWEPGETLVVCGPAGFRDFWPHAIVASLRRPGSWRGQPMPGRVEPVTVDLPGLAGRHNLSGLDIARAFDDPVWRDQALDTMARAVERLAGGDGRVALPAVLGLDDHAAVLEAARRRLPLLPFEVALAPPSVPGLRLYRALRAALLRRRGRLQIGEPVRGAVGEGHRVERLVGPAAAREFVLTVGAVVLATGGIAGGGIVGLDDGSLRETVLGLPVDAPLGDPWLLPDAFDPPGHPLETAGIRTDADLRPVAPRNVREPLAENVRIVGSLLAGQRYLRERCGDGVAIASALVASRSLGAHVAALAGPEHRLLASGSRAR